MKITIDLFDGAGPRDYTHALDAERPPRLYRRLNQPTELRAWLVSDDPNMLVPPVGSRVMLARDNGNPWFTGFIVVAPTHEYLGWNQRGPAYRYELVAYGEESLLERKRGLRRAAFTDRSAGSALKELTEDLLPGGFDLSDVEDVAVLPFYFPSSRFRWSEHARRLALRARAAYRVLDGKLYFAPVGAAVHHLDESAPNFCPDSLQLVSPQRHVSRVAVQGGSEPSAHVKDYFLADGYTLRFNLSESPFVRNSTTILDEEYLSLRPSYWSLTDPTSAISVSGGKLRVEGGAGVARGTRMRFAELLEMGGALVLQHGDFTFTAASDATLGGLFDGDPASAPCVAGFRITPNGSENTITPWIHDAASGSPVVTVAGRRYVLATRIYASEIYRSNQLFHSSTHPAGSGRGGDPVSADLRVVLEVREIDPNDPPSQVAPATVLFDGVLSAAPAFCSYALVSTAQLHAWIAFTRILRAPEAEVRSCAPSQPYRTRLVGALSDGAECRVDSAGLQFFSASVPATDEKIEVRYRAATQAVAEIADPAEEEPPALPADDGVRDLVVRLVEPPPRSAQDCANAAQALLDDLAQPAWSGEYRVASDFLPGGVADIFPGDALAVDVPSRAAAFQAIIREVELAFPDPAGDRALFAIRFANDAAEPLAAEIEAPTSVLPDNIAPAASPLADLAAAEVTGVTSTSITVDAGAAPPGAGGVEVRRTDAGWGPDNDRNLLGRFNVQVFALPRLSRVQDFFLRQYSGPNYSLHSTLLHVDYPL